MERDDEWMTTAYGEAAARHDWTTSADSVRSEFGIIYIGWHGGMADYGIERDRWTDFAESCCAAWRGLPGKLAWKQWLNDDLFLCVRGTAEGGRSFEEWLLRLARRIRTEWEEMYRSAGRSSGKTYMAARLHAGTKALTQESRPDQEQGVWYEAMKQALIHGQQADAPERSLRRMAFGRIVDEELLEPVYQPIVSLVRDDVFGYEALSRLKDQEWFAGPLQLFKFAEEEGMFYALDRLARRIAIAGCGIGTSGPKLFINMSARIMEDPHFTPGQTRGLLERCGLSPADIVFELTERTSIDDFAAAKKVLSHYRSQGYKIAIDDVGAGYSSLQSIVELKPDYLKVDRSITNGIDADETKRYVMATIVSLAEQTGSLVVAEGIERREELDTVRAMGVPLGQGYLLGRPARRG